MHSSSPASRPSSARLPAPRPSPRRRGRRSGAAIDALEERRLFASLELGDRLTTPIVNFDVPGVGNYDAATRALSLSSTGYFLQADGGIQTLTPPANLTIGAKVGNDGALIDGVAGDDLVVSQDPDGAGPIAPTVLLRGEIAPGGFAYDADSSTFEFIFRPTGGTLDPTYFTKATDPNYVGVQLRLGNESVSLASSFSGLSTKGSLGAIPAPPGGSSQSTLSGYVYADCNCDGVKQPGETPIAGASVSLYSGNTLVTTVQTDAAGKYTFGALPPGVYRIVEAQPAGYVDGKDTLGTGTATPGTNPSNDTFNVTLAGGENAVNYNFGENRPAKVEGYVWADFNDDGKIDFNEGGIGCVTVSLYKFVGNGYVKVATQSTDASGKYSFGNLCPGTYAITECQPCGFADGKESLGTVNGVANGIVNCGYFSNVTLGCGGVGVDYNFGERPEAGCGIRCGDTGSVCFYAGKTGKALITSLNGSAGALQLGNWLAATFPNLYGATSGAGKSLAGKTNAQVYDAFLTKAGSSSLKLDAQVMALALSVYVTSTDLAGTIASKYGFKVSEFGVGARSFSVSGCCSNVQVMDLLLGTDDASCGGNLLGGNKCLKDYALCIFTAINESGDSHCC